MTADPDRREFLKVVAVAGVGLTLGGCQTSGIGEDAPSTYGRVRFG